MEIKKEANEKTREKTFNNIWTESKPESSTSMKTRLMGQNEKKISNEVPGAIKIWHVITLFFRGKFLVQKRGDVSDWSQVSKRGCIWLLSSSNTEIPD